MSEHSEQKALDLDKMSPWAHGVMRFRTPEQLKYCLLLVPESRGGEPSELPETDLSETSASSHSGYQPTEEFQIAASSMDRRWTEDADLAGRRSEQQAQIHGWIPTLQLAYTAVGWMTMVKRGTPDVADQRLERYSSTVVPAGKAGRHRSSANSARAVREFIRSSRVAQLVLLLLVLLMTSMVVGDGVLTPAQKEGLGIHPTRVAPEGAMWRAGMHLPGDVMSAADALQPRQRREGAPGHSIPQYT
ncbi:hypothetical protein WJX84_007079 [Apatococcus fuscideae]|uniref:Uncharacterized protein n=1 Tax=Apatococcus fuscideae TaxID=2026836 RepID=A0AAW1SWS9_9CHLO